MHVLEQGLDLGYRFAFDSLSHERSRSRRNGTAMAHKTDFFDEIAIDSGINRQLVATQRVMTVGAMAGVIHGMAVARVTVMVKDDFLVKLAVSEERRVG